VYIDGYNLAIDGLLRLPEIEAWPAHADQVVSVAITPQTSEHDPGRRRRARPAGPRVDRQRRDRGALVVVVAAKRGEFGTFSRGGTAYESWQH